MLRSQTTMKHKWLVLCILTLASIVFTGCDNGSLGVKTGSILGYVIDEDTNQPISEVLVRATTTAENKSVYSDGDGSFCLGDATKGTWTLTVEKYGYIVATESTTKLTCNVNNGETLNLAPIKMSRTTVNVRGTLKGYPIDAVTGRPITNFTISQTAPYNERKSKSFDNAKDFQESGWTGLEGGIHNYTITAKNYVIWDSTAVTEYKEGINIGKSVTDLGTIKMQPLTVSISGTFSKVPGYVLNAKNIVVFAESAGKVVASYTLLDETTSKGTLTYMIDNVPVTANTVSVTCKAKGYEKGVISSAVPIASANPGGVISSVDFDFSKLEPITADLRVTVRGKKPETDKPGTFETGDVAEVTIQGGTTSVGTYQVTSHKNTGTVVIPGVTTGYPIKVIVNGITKGYCSVTSSEITIPEETEIYPISLELDES